MMYMKAHEVQELKKSLGEDVNMIDLFKNLKNDVKERKPKNKVTDEGSKPTPEKVLDKPEYLLSNLIPSLSEVVFRFMSEDA